MCVRERCEKHSRTHLGPRDAGREEGVGEEGVLRLAGAVRVDLSRKVDIRLHGKRNSKLTWRKAGQPRHLVDVEDSDQ